MGAGSIPISIISISIDSFLCRLPDLVLGANDCIGIGRLHISKASARGIKTSANSQASIHQQAGPLNMVDDLVFTTPVATIFVPSTLSNETDRGLLSFEGLRPYALCGPSILDV